MEFKLKYLIVGMFLLLLVGFANAKELTQGELDNILIKPNLSSIAEKQVEITDRLDSSYIVRERETLHKTLKQIDPIVFIDKKVGTTYHVDSQRDFVENETVLLEFFYDIQPDSIAHYKHSGEFDRYFFPTQWNWTANCSGEYDCSGGWVTVEVSNIDEGFGSNTFPIGITGPTWATQGQYYAEFDGVDDYVFLGYSNIIMPEDGENFTISLNFYPIVQTTGDRIFTIEGASLSNLWVIYDTNGLDIQYKNTSGNALYIVQDEDLAQNNWYNLIIVREGGDFRAYLNNVLIGDVTDNFNSWGTNENFILMANNGPNSDYGKGYLSNILIYNQSLTQEEITTLYNSYTETDNGILRNSEPNSTGLVLYMPFDDASVEDKSGNANHGTNYGATFTDVLLEYVTLTNAVDYTIDTSSGLFTIVNNDYVWSWMNASWDYVDGEDCATLNVEGVGEAFGLFVVGLLGFLGIIGVIIAIVWLMNYIKPLFSKEDGIQSLYGS